MTRGSPGMRRPALLHVCGKYLPLSETFTYDLIKGLDGFGHHVVASAIENLQHFPLEAVHVPDPDELSWALARAVDARVVVCHFGPQATMGMPIALALDRPAVTLFHGYDISRLLRDPRWIERYRAVARLGMHALCISNAGRARLLDIGWPASQIDVIRLGVDVGRFAFRPPSDRWGGRSPRRMLMVARLVEKKGVHVALEAMRRLRQRGLDLELHVVGDGPERGRLEQTIARHGLANVTLLGALDRERTRHEFAEAHLYIQPSVTAESGDQEGIPVSLMEAQACGLPVISTRHSGIPELVHDETTGLLTGEGDADGLVIAVERLVRNPAQAQRFAEAGRAHVLQHFDRDTQHQAFAAHLEALGSEPTRRPSVSLARRPRARRRGLVIRSIPLGLTARKLLLLAERYPDVQWDLLTDRATSLDAARVPLVTNVFARDDGRLSLRSLGIGLLQRLQETDYDVVVVPYPDDAGEGCAHLRRAATEVGARHVVALTLGDREVPVPPRRRRLRLIRPADAPWSMPRGA